MGPVPATMVGGHAEEAERLRDSGSFADAVAERTQETSLPMDARGLASDATSYLRLAIQELHYNAELSARYAALAQAAALTSLARQKAGLQ